MSAARRLVVGNWKMHGSHPANAELLAGILGARPFGCDVAVCVPFPYLSETAVSLAASDLRWGAQDCSAHAQGAYTGEVSAAMLAEFGCRYAIVGHSERRALHGESDQGVADKAKAALGSGVTPIVCVGETREQREAGETAAVVKRQLSAVIHTLAHCVSEMVVAYEPVWAIGTGLSATPQQAQEVHELLRAQLQAASGHASRIRILYGGSVKPDNAAVLFSQPDIDGALVGGASLKAADFVAICRAAG
ncbi:MAG: triose-phosphate isomerase [Rubrivivax sp.]|nr:triose-phosphate isomerase [Rubrivivax sp.]